MAAVIAEPVMGAGGVIVPPETYFPALREICDRHDVLLIADEIITGFCRTGTWFALEHWKVEPDIVVFAKGVSSGYIPLGGILLSDRIHRAIQEAPADLKYMHAATYSGHPTCCAVGLANVAIMEREDLNAASRVKGQRLLEGLQSLREYPVVGDVRGLGLMCGVELVTNRETRAPAIGLGGRIIVEARARGLFTRIRGGGAGRVSHRRHDLPRPAAHHARRRSGPHREHPARRDSSRDGVIPVRRRPARRLRLYRWRLAGSGQDAPHVTGPDSIGENDDVLRTQRRAGRDTRRRARLRPTRDRAACRAVG